MAEKLTKAQALYLGAIHDWAAPYEVQATLGLMTVKTATVEKVLKFLVRDGFAKYGATQNTYRITPAGRLALENTDEKRNRPAHVEQAGSEIAVQRQHDR
ncbi:hypothetical protein [Bosea sp. NPDC055594]